MNWLTLQEIAEYYKYEVAQKTIHARHSFLRYVRHLIKERVEMSGGVTIICKKSNYEFHSTK